MRGAVDKMKTGRLVQRILGYAATSFLAMCAGLFVNKLVTFSPFSYAPEHLVIAVSIFLVGIPFYIAYAYVYDYSDSSSLWPHHKTVIILVGVIFILMAIIVLLLISKFASIYKYVGLLILQFSLMVTHTVHTVCLYGKNEKKLIRNWLINPVLFSIALGFALPHAVANIEGSYFHLNFVPIYAFLAYSAMQMLFKKILTKRRFRNISLTIITIIVLVFSLSLIPYPNIPEWIKNLFVCAVFSAFFASFESWRITDSVIRKLNESDIGNNAHYKSTATAMCLGLLVIPCLLLTDYFQSVFYFGVMSLGIFGCFYWFVCGTSSKRFLSQNWVLLKNILGFIILLLVCVDLGMKFSLPKWIADFYGVFQFQTLLAVFGVFLFLANSFLSEYFQHKKRIIMGDIVLDASSSRGKAWIIIKKMFSKPRNFNRALGMLSFVIFLVLFLIDIMGNHADSVKNQIRAAELLYFIISILCIIFDICEKVLDFKKDNNVFLPSAGNANDNNAQSSYSKSVLGSFRGVLRLVRVSTGLLIEAIVTIPLVANSVPLSHALLCGLPFAITAMAGFALNDCVDYRKDAISKPHRAIPNGMISHLSAYRVVIVLFATSFLTSIAAASTQLEFVIYLLTMFGVIFYNIVVKHVAALKTILAALICVMPIVFVGIFTENSIVAVPVAAFAMIYVIGREIRMDILDCEGDRADGIRTLPIILGERIAIILSNIAIYSALFCICFLSLFYSNSTYISLLLVIIMISQIICECMWRSFNRSAMRKSILVQWIPMVAGLLIFIV